MNNLFRMIFCGLFLLVAQGAAASTQYADTIRFRFATVEEAQTLLGSDDAFTRGGANSTSIPVCKRPPGPRPN